MSSENASKLCAVGLRCYRNESDQFHSATAKTVEDAQKLIEAGFEYVCEFDEVKIFKKRK